MVLQFERSFFGKRPGFGAAAVPAAAIQRRVLLDEGSAEAVM